MVISQITTLSKLGGAQEVVIQLAKALSDDGHSVSVVAAAEGEMWSMIPEAVRKVKMKHFQRSVSFIQDIKAWSELRRERELGGGDVFHLHSSKAAMLGRWVFDPSKTIYTVHGVDTIALANPRFLLLEVAMSRRSRVNVGVSHYDACKMKRLGFRNVEWIYNGIRDPISLEVNDITGVIGRVEECRRRFGFVVLCIARLSSQKNFPLFREAACMMKDVGFVWVGNETEIAGNPANLVMLGPIKGASRLLRYCDVFCLPSHYEGLPISVIEAMAFSRPVVASSVGGVPELLKYDNGAAVPNSVVEFVSAIDVFRRDSAFREACGRRGRDAFVRYFTVDVMYGNYNKLYKAM